jgi:putative transposase
MRSRKKNTITSQEVHQYAKNWLSEELGLQDYGRKCKKSVLLSIMLVAAARICSIYAACRDLAYAPSDQAVRDALLATLPDVAELEKRLNASLCIKVPKILKRKPRQVAIDLNLIPYHGQPHEDETEIYHSAPKSGTTNFHAYATAYVTHKGLRYTLALTWVKQGEKMDEVVKRLLRIVRDRGVKIGLLLLDKGFFSTAVIRYLKRARCPFLMPVVMRGRNPKSKQPPQGLRAFLTQKNGWYEHSMKDKGGREKFDICVASKYYVHKKTGRRRKKRLVFASWNYQGTPEQTRETYRKRFGIESSYRQMHQARIRTCTRDPKLRLLFVGIALILRNVWVWLHYEIFAETKGEQPLLRLHLLRFRRMLHWVESIVKTMLHNGEDYCVQWEA